MEQVPLEKDREWERGWAVVEEEAWDEEEGRVQALPAFASARDAASRSHMLRGIHAIRRNARVVGQC